MVKRETQEYATKDETIEETVGIKYNYLYMLVMHYLRTTSSTEKAYKNTF